MSILFQICLWVMLLAWQCEAQTTTAAYAQTALTMGINYGTLGDNLPSPADAVAKIVSMKLGRVKVFEPSQTIFTALANSGLEVVVAIPNNDIAGIGASATTADSWVAQNIATYYPATNFVVILVGNEIFSYSSLQSTWSSLVPAMQNLYTSLQNRGWSGKIKISTAVALDVLSASYPPSTGTFRTDIAESVMKPLLSFLTTTNSYFYVNVYPFLAYSTSTDISLDYALFGSTATSVVDGTLTYTNLMDAQLDAVYSAAEKLGYSNMRIAVGETGWPSKGDADQAGASITNAATYNRRLVRKILSTTNVGTPLRPDVFIPTYIFALFNEDLKTGATSERNWGLLYPDMTAVYAIDLTGQLQDSQYTDTTSVGSPPPSSSPPTSASGTWCVSNPAATEVTLMNALNYACGVSTDLCSAIQVGQSCFAPNTTASHASWAFNGYWQKYKGVGGSCSFDGAAVLTSTDPSYIGCTYSQ